MKKLITVLALATMITAPLASAAFAGLPGAYYQRQQQGGYPQSPPGGS